MLGRYRAPNVANVAKPILERRAVIHIAERSAHAPAVVVATNDDMGNLSGTKQVPYEGSSDGRRQAAGGGRTSRNSTAYWITDWTLVSMARTCPRKRATN